MSVGKPYRDPRSRVQPADWLVRVSIGQTKRFRGPNAERDARAFYEEHVLDDEDAPLRGRDAQDDIAR